MRPDIKPLTAFERARIAYELMVQRQREAFERRLALDRSRSIKVVALCGCLFALILGAAIYNDWLPQSLRSAAGSRTSDDGKFVKTRNGQVRSFISGNTCQELQFSNDRGMYVSGNLVPCQAEVRRDAPVPSNGARVNSIRDAFTSR